MRLNRLQFLCSLGLFPAAIVAKPKTAPRTITVKLDAIDAKSLARSIADIHVHHSRELFDRLSRGGSR